MREAVSEDGALLAPSVGTWRPAVGLGAPLHVGATLGVLWRDDRPLTVTVPERVEGAVIELVPSGTWVSAGTVLVRVGAGGTLVAAGVSASSAGGATGGPDGARAIRAETDGTVYLSPEPGAPSFAPVGVPVAAQATLALVEVMKTFTPVRAPVAGAVVRVDVTSGQAVREGQVLLWLAP